MRNRKRVCKSDRKLANKKNYIRQLKENKRVIHDRITRIRSLEKSKKEMRANVSEA